MTIMRLSALDGFLRRADPAIRALLVYGGDVGEVADACRRLLAIFAGDGSGVVQLDERVIATDPGRLADEVQAISLLGDTRVIWVRGGDAQLAKVLAPLLESPSKGNFILVEGGGLGKSSPLRTLFEESPAALCLPLYEPSIESAAAVVSDVLRESKLAITPEAQLRLLDLTGKSAPLLRREAEKLALYCHGAESVGLADVKAICGQGSEAETDALLLAVFGGDVEAADRQFDHLFRTGVDAGRIASLAHAHALRLVDLRQAVERGASPEQAVKSARPPIFFKVQQAYAGQLKVWPSAALLGAASSLATAVLESRSTPALADVLVNRALLATARRARSARAERW